VIQNGGVFSHKPTKVVANKTQQKIFRKLKFSTHLAFKSSSSRVS